MKHFYFSFMFLLHSLCSFAQYDDPPPPILDEDLEHNTSKDSIVFVNHSYYPYLLSCQDSTLNYSKSLQCSNKRLIEYIYNSLEPPKDVQQFKVEGMVVLSFTIKKTGIIDLNSIKILRDIGGGCGVEGVRIVKNINKDLGPFFPAQRDNQPIDVQYNLPIRFKIP